MKTFNYRTRTTVGNSHQDEDTPVGKQSYKGLEQKDQEIVKNPGNGAKNVWMLNVNEYASLQ